MVKVCTEERAPRSGQALGRRVLEKVCVGALSQVKKL